MALRVHHLNCTTMCPPGGRLMDGRMDVSGPAALVCHCLLVETDRNLVLVDTGFGLNDVRMPRPRLSPLFLKAMCRPQLSEGMTAIRQIERLGFKPTDVTDILLTHLDFDHAGGLDDFPWARVHLLDAEYLGAVAQKTPLDQRRFRPSQWMNVNWVTYPKPEAGERWFGFECVRDLSGLPPELLLVPLQGHTVGHSGIALQVGGRWLLHAGDAYFHHREMDVDKRRCPPGLRFYQTFMEKNRRQRLYNQERLRALVKGHGSEVTVFSAHDAVEFERLESLEKVPLDSPFLTFPLESERPPTLHA
ncbi:MBL fold metallo-hydrolase [Stigmatella erecta]|uniref:Glyoxylase, beta-lactamase superfamily II n=1 Tax=Stigmatella erecta TaxID=83460 RepID=A0A1I0KB55_9BACT|nr:MBL fold metallo-hydrolase [Stigmatella erecta]SEU21427.1 Glyoxylase, beta-lactamase superfamily II [Stigmatella erecta]